MAADPEARLDLTRPRVYGELLSTSVQIFTRHADVLFTLAILLVAPVTLIVDGIWGRLLADGLDAKPSTASQAVSAGLNVLVVLPLMTAAGALLVRGLGRGDAPADVRGALRSASGVFPRVLGAQLLYAVVVVIGFILLVVPGVYLAVRCYFATQAAAVDGLAPPAAMRRSADLVHGSWWRTLGCLLLTGLLVGATVEIAIAILGATGSGALYVAGRVVGQAIAVAVTAVFATLLFYDLRARGERAAVAAG